MDFFDPSGEPLVTPKELVKVITRHWIQEKALYVAPCVLMVVVSHDLRALNKMLRGEPVDSWKKYRELYRGNVGNGSVTLAHSPVGAPNAVALAEELAAFGMRKLLFLGYCGSLQEEVKAGDIVVPTEAIREEGTSFHYIPPGVLSEPHHKIQTLIIDVLRRNKVPFHQGRIWTTDALYRETGGKVKRYQQEGALGVEMELSALFAFGMAQGIQVGGLLVVSDELCEGSWLPLFASPYLIKGVRRVRKLALEILNGML
jgi:uridine phosphorylase